MPVVVDEQHQVGGVVDQGAQPLGTVGERRPAGDVADRRDDAGHAREVTQVDADHLAQADVAVPGDDAELDRDPRARCREPRREALERVRDVVGVDELGRRTVDVLARASSRGRRSTVALPSRMSRRRRRRARAREGCRATPAHRSASLTCCSLTARCPVSLNVSRTGPSGPGVMRVIDAMSRRMRHENVSSQVERPQDRGLDRRDVAHRDDRPPASAARASSSAAQLGHAGPHRRPGSRRPRG